MGDRDEYEADLFRRYELRIVALEFKVEALEGVNEKYTPVIEALHEAALVATALKAKMEKARLGTLSRTQIVVGVLALFVPSFVSAGLTLLIVGLR